MNKDLIETPRFNFFIGDEVFLKGKIVGFNVDENKFVENVVRLEYGQTLNVPNINIYTKNDITDKPKIKVKVQQCVADWIEVCKEHLTTSLYTAMNPNFMKENNQSFDLILWIKKTSNQEAFARAWLDGYEIQGTKYIVTDGNHLYFKNYQEDIEIVRLVDEQPGTMEYVKKFDTKEEAQKAADILGWKVQEVE
ncbi:hypothetical protein D8852_07285 [Streptococcus mitis]|uniref:Phage protein n=1 Tax=Streptococcus mitis TaxID=28037 RepID=A0A428EC88_STRMT|nr:DUF1642 domain-containing protein [Streptococcus mitis]RSI79992.1 hypothetical protein D8852_07285 [Streptococcus mitis]RSJ07684.1 hypothetical protein D8839_05870 [Streptococcus mitis]